MLKYVQTGCGTLNVKLRNLSLCIPCKVSPDARLEKQFKKSRYSELTMSGHVNLFVTKNECFFDEFLIDISANYKKKMSFRGIRI